MSVTFKSVCHLELWKLEIFDVRKSLWSDFASLYKISLKSDKPLWSYDQNCIFQYGILTPYWILKFWVWWHFITLVTSLAQRTLPIVSKSVRYRHTQFHSYMRTRTIPVVPVLSLTLNVDTMRHQRFLRRSKRCGFCPPDLPLFDNLNEAQEDQLFSAINHNPSIYFTTSSYHRRQLLLKATTSGTEHITDLYPIVLDILWTQDANFISRKIFKDIYWMKILYL